MILFQLFRERFQYENNQKKKKKLYKSFIMKLTSVLRFNSENNESREE